MARDSGLYGQLIVTAIDRKGGLFVYKTPNTLTNEAARQVSHLLVGDNFANLKVTEFKVGTGSTAPLRTDTDLETPVHQQAVTEITFPDVGQVEFKMVLDFVTAANGFQLVEAGLFSADGNSLFARQVHTVISKDENYKIEYRWRIVFT